MLVCGIRVLKCIGYMMNRMINDTLHKAKKTTSNKCFFWYLKCLATKREKKTTESKFQTPIIKFQVCFKGV